MIAGQNLSLPEQKHVAYQRISFVSSSAPPSHRGICSSAAKSDEHNAAPYHHIDHEQPRCCPRESEKATARITRNAHLPPDIIHELGGPDRNTVRCRRCQADEAEGKDSDDHGKHPQHRAGRHGRHHAQNQGERGEGNAHPIEDLEKGHGVEDGVAGTAVDEFVGRRVRWRGNVGAHGDVGAILVVDVLAVTRGHDVQAVPVLQVEIPDDVLIRVVDDPDDVRRGSVGGT